ncbi:MAG TPA: DUF6491 family protein [Arenimonas sp.]|jgi:hypothetical protein|nr:DUF6491 family protein [Arenimonas sp.]
MIVRTFAVTALLALAAGCASAPADRAATSAKAEQELELARLHAAEPVSRVRFLRPMDSFEVISDRAIVVWETPFKAWLVELRESPACTRLDNELGLGFDIMSGDSLSTTAGWVVGRNGLRCKMDSIREIDVPAWRDAKRTAGL